MLSGRARFAIQRHSSVALQAIATGKAPLATWGTLTSARVQVAPSTVRSFTRTPALRTSVGDLLKPSDTFARRHIGPNEKDVQEMLRVVGSSSLDEFIDSVVPKQIRLEKSLNIGPALSESEMHAHLKEIASKNKILRSNIGMGYYNTIVPPVILRNILESPAWYTPYTPYQAEVSQGRLQSLLNFQTGVIELTGMEVANASLLDEATAGAEAMTMCYSIANRKKNTFLVSDTCHPQTIGVMQTRASGFNINLKVVKTSEIATHDLSDVCGAMIQYPDTFGHIASHKELADHLHKNGALCVVATDLLALCVAQPPGTWGADIAFGSAQRFGVPMGYGGPNAAFFATHQQYKRSMPGRIIGVSKDVSGKLALRMALQTREQHIRREKATSNICTAQALLANTAAFYMLYHGPSGLKRIAERTHAIAVLASKGASQVEGVTVVGNVFFDTVHVRLASASSDKVLANAVSHGINLRKVNDREITFSFDETSTPEHAVDIVNILSETVSPHAGKKFTVDQLSASLSQSDLALPTEIARTTPPLSHPIFSSITSETEMLRYIYELQNKDLGLQTAMIPLGSCTMKLNATTEMIPITWPEFGALHPFAPVDQAKGYQELFERLETQLKEITGFDYVSLQPNSGAQGEYAGLMAIRDYHLAHNAPHRTVCLIPHSAHGTNPASAVMCGFVVEPVDCDEHGNVDKDDLARKAEKHAANLGALMITYPSTHGVFEETVKELCSIVHSHGGLVYMDGANMNAQVGLCRPADMGADVCHLNLHKTFCIPHGGGGPGMGPICVVPRLAKYLPSHPVVPLPERTATPVSAAPFGSSSILPIPYAYITMMGGEGLTHATKIAILSANYMAARLKGHYEILYTGANGRVAHEFILDLRPFKAALQISESDVAKRLLDYSFHAPTMSWPVGGTLMFEPTESEPKSELDRLCDALISIRAEIKLVEDGQIGRSNNPLKHAPHPMSVVLADNWRRPYTREQAAFPVESLRTKKFWPTVSRLDDVYGDRNLVCSCPSMDEYKTDK